MVIRTNGRIDNDGIILAIVRIDVLTLDGAFDLGLGAVLDTLAIANELAAPGPAPFDVRTIGMRRTVRTQQGFRFSTQPVSPRSRCDVVVVPALGCKTPETLEAALARRDVREATAWLRLRARQGARITAACTGTFVLAASALLDGHRATTTWWLAPTFRARFPAVELDESHMLVESGAIVTAGAALAHLDLALWLVRGVSPSLADVVSRYLLVEARPTQALYAIPDHLSHSDELVARFEQWVRRRLAHPFDAQASARAIGTSTRTLARRIRRTLGKTPVGYVQELRVAHALHRLRTSDASLDEIAAEVGYRDGLTLRVLLRRKTGRGVRELRRRA